MASNIESRLVFIHGAGGTSRVWRYQAAAFPKSSALHLPGHPNGNGCSQVREYADFVVQTIAQRKLAPAVIAGHSMGGAIALEIALASPDLLEAIVLVGSGARLRVAPVIMNEIVRDYAHAAEMIVEWAYSPKTSPIVRKASVQELLEIPAKVTYGDFEACDHFDRMNDIHRIALPTLIICGADDKLTPVKYSQYMKEKIPNARLEVIPDAGHSVMLEKPEELNSAIRSFINALRSQ